MTDEPKTTELATTNDMPTGLACPTPDAPTVPARTFLPHILPSTNEESSDRTGCPIKNFGFKSGASWVDAGPELHVCLCGYRFRASDFVNGVHTHIHDSAEANAIRERLAQAEGRDRSNYPVGQELLLYTEELGFFTLFMRNVTLMNTFGAMYEHAKQGTYWFEFTIDKITTKSGYKYNSIMANPLPDQGIDVRALPEYNAAVALFGDTSADNSEPAENTGGVGE